MTSIEVSFEGKSVLITGGGNGIGRELCKRLYSLKAEVFALDKIEDDLKSLVGECQGIKTICVDLANWNSTREAISKIVGPINCLVNNAGIGGSQNFMNITPERFDLQMDVNVKAIINVSQVIAQKMITEGKGGSIVNVSSLASKCPSRSSVAYNITKASVDMLTKSMAVELGPHNIRVNTVNPTIVMTNMGRDFAASSASNNPMDNILKSITSRTPLGRIAETHEIVNIIIFLLSDLAPIINGEHIFGDGGYSSF